MLFSNLGSWTRGFAVRTYRPAGQRVVAALLLCSVIMSAQAETLWLAPASPGVRTILGTWPVTKTGRANFSFALPDDVAEIICAKLVLLPSADAEISYQVRLALSQAGLSADDFTDEIFGSNVDLERHILTEIDISSVIPSIEMLVPGRDYLTVGFTARNTGSAQIAEAANVLGFKLEYEHISVSPGEAL